MEQPHQTLKSRPAWSITMRWLAALVILTLFAGAMIPLVMKPRKRSRATSILEEMRLIDGAKDQYAIENNHSGELNWEDIKKSLKEGTKLHLDAPPTTPTETEETPEGPPESDT